MRMLRRLRALVRVEWRQIRQAKTRSFLIALLIALPVAGVIGGSTLLRIVIMTPEERVKKELGAADLRVTLPTEQSAVLSTLPPSTRVEKFWVRGERLLRDGLTFSASRFPWRDGSLASAMFDLDQGRSPRNSEEAVVSRLLARAASIELEEEIWLSSEKRSVKVVGTILDPEDLERALVAIGPGLPPPPMPRTTCLIKTLGRRQTNEIAHTLKSAGAQVLSADEIRYSPTYESQAIFVLGSLGFVEAALVVAAAFAIGLRRRQREVGLIGATGASPREILVAILTSASALAVLGTGLGLLLGLGVVRLLHPFLDAWSGRRTGAFEFSAQELVAALVMGVVTAILAALWPARGATRLPIRVALSGRRPRSDSGRSWLLIGVALIGTSLFLTVSAWKWREQAALPLLMLGCVLGVLGFGACCPWLLLQISKLASRLPISWRLALRDAGRFRHRNGPVVTAVLAGMAISVTVASAIASLKSLERGPLLRSDQLRVHGSGAEVVCGRLEGALDVEAWAPLQAATYQGAPIRAEAAGEGPRGWVAVGGLNLLHTLGAEIDAWPDSESIIVLGDSGVAPSEVELFSAQGDSLGVHALTSISLEECAMSPRLILSDTLRRKWGFDVGSPPFQTSPTYLVRLDQTVTPEVVKQAQRVVGGIDGTGLDATVLQERGPRWLFRIIFALSLLTGVLVIAIATKLTAVESESDRITLLQVGAPPQLLHRHAGARAAFLALLGCALAIPAGLLPAYGVLASLGGFPFIIPWKELALILIGLPMFTYVGAWISQGAIWRDAFRRGNDFIASPHRVSLQPQKRTSHKRSQKRTS